MNDEVINRPRKRGSYKPRAAKVAVAKKQAEVTDPDIDLVADGEGGIDFVAKSRHGEAPRATEASVKVQSRSRNAEANIFDDETYAEDDLQVLSRQSRDENFVSEFELPDNYKKPGWDYEWKTTKVNQAEVDPSDMTFYAGQGWRLVRASAMPKMNPPGSTSKFVERRGQILMTRPMWLTKEAKDEEYAAAEQQKMDKLKAAAIAGPSEVHGMAGKINPVGLEVNISAEAGVHKQRSAA